MLRPSAFAPSFFIILACAWFVSADPFQGATYDLTLPDGWVQIPQDVVTRTMQQVSAGGSGAVPFHFDAGFQQKDQPWFTYPYVLVQTVPYPKEPSEAEMRGIIKQVSGSQTMDQAKTNLSPAMQSIISGMSVKPGELDTTTHTFKTFMQQDIRGIGKLNGMIESHFGHSGLVSINCYAREADFDKFAPQFQRMTGSFTFHPGEEYQGKRSSGNVLGRIGAYGLIAIVVGLILGAFRKKKA